MIPKLTNSLKMFKILVEITQPFIVKKINKIMVNPHILTHFPKKTINDIL